MLTPIRYLGSAVAVGALSLGLVACSDDNKDSSSSNTDETTQTTESTETTTAEAGTIVEVATEAGDFTTLLTAVEAAGLAETLQGDGPFTVFAPTDAAFAALPAGTLDSLLADTDALSNVLLYHVVQGQAVPASDVVGLTEVTMANGDTVTVEVKGDEVILNGNVKVTTTDIQASNGVIHVIDAVLIPPAA